MTYVGINTELIKFLSKLKRKESHTYIAVVAKVGEKISRGGHD